MAFKTRKTTESITLPIGDQEYTIDAPSMDTGLMIQGVTEGMAMLESGREEEALKIFERTGAKVDMDDEEEIEFYERLLGPDNYQNMRKNGVDFVTLKRATSTVMVWVLQGIEAAQNVWNTDDPTEAGAAVGPKSSTKKTTTSTPKTSKNRKTG